MEEPATLRNAFEVALIAAGAAAMGSSLVFVASVRNHAKSLFVSTITQERAIWRKELRQTCVELVSIVHRQRLVRSDENLCSFHEKRVGVLLRVNPYGETASEEHPYDGAIIRALAALEAIMGGSKAIDDEAVLTALKDLERNVQALLKYEWDKSKREGRTGRMSSYDAPPQPVDDRSGEVDDPLRDATR